MNITPLNQPEILYLRTLFFDSQEQLRVDVYGIVSILMRGQIRKIGRISFEKGVMTYHQLEKISHLLKGWSAWTLDEVIYKHLQPNAVIKYYSEYNIFTYEKQDIEKYKEQTSTGTLSSIEHKFEQRYFTGHGLRLILPLTWSKIENHSFTKKEFSKFFI